MNGKPSPKVIDFGLAKALGHKLTDQSFYTEFGKWVGTLEYSSPEQAAGSYEVDTLSDVYSLGVLLYELLVGAPPFTRAELEHAGEMKMRAMIADGVQVKPSTNLSSSKNLPSIAANRHLDPGKLTKLVRGELDWIVMKCLEKERARRYETANQLGQELQRFLANEPVQAGPPSATYRLRKFVRRHKARLLMTAAMLLVTVLGVALAFWQVSAALEREKNANFLSGQRLEIVEQQKKEVQEALERKNQAQADLKAQLSQAARVYCDRSDVEFQRGNLPDSLNWMLRAYETAKRAEDPLEQSYRHFLAGQSQFLEQKLVRDVEAVAFSPDGCTVLTANSDKTARLWDTVTGKPLGAPLKYEGEVLAVAYRRDRGTVLTGDDDTMARLWDVATGKPVGVPLQLEGEGGVRMVFSPDGRTVLTLRSRKTMRLWDAATGKPAGAAIQHEHDVFSVAFSPDSRTVLTGGGDNTAQLWDAATGKPVGARLKHEAPVWVVAFSPDGRSFLTGSWDHTARLWDAATGKPVGAPLEHEASVWAVAFSPDGRSILTGSQDMARLWDAATGKPVGAPLQHEGQVRTVVFSPDGRTVLTRTTEMARLWDAATGKPVGAPFQHEDELRTEGGGEATTVAYSTLGRSVVPGVKFKSARLWDAATGKPVGAPLQHDGQVWSVAFSPDCRTVLTYCSDKTARLWDAAAVKPIGAALRHESIVYAVAYSSDGRTVLTGSWDNTARLWDTAAGKLVGPSLQHSFWVKAVAYSPDGRTVLTGSGDKTARLWDAATGKPLGVPLQHEGEVGAVAYSPDGRTVLTGSDDKTARLWDAATGKPLGVPLQHEGGVKAVAYSPDGRTVLTGSDNLVDNMVQLWDAATCKRVGTSLKHLGEVNAVAFSPDGRTVLTPGSDDHTARLWDTATGKPLGPPLQHRAWVTAVAFSPNGRTVITGSADRTARLWDVATCTPLGAPLQHEERVHAVAYSPDGHTVLSCDEDKARLWDASTGKPLGSPLHHEGSLWAVAYSPDGRTVLTGSADKTARLWQVVAPAPDDRSRLRASVNVRTGRAFDDEGVLRILDQADLLQACKELEAHGGEWQAKPSGTRWQFAQAGEATFEKRWFAVDFHLRRLLTDPPKPAEPYSAAERLVELAEQLQKSNPDSTAPLELLGAALFRARDYSEAVKHLNAAIEKKQNDATVWTQMFLAMSHYQLGNAAKANDWLQRADAQIAQCQDNKVVPINWQDRLRNQKLRQEAADMLKSSH